MAQLSDDCFAHGGRLTTTQEALDLIDQRIVPVADAETVALRAAANRILAEDVVAARHVPPHDNSAVDGYAFAFDGLGPDEATAFTLAGRAAAGHPFDRAVREGEAVRIFTGAPMPAGCDTVAMQEDCREEDAGGERRIAIPHGLKRGDNRRRRGEDVSAGSTILAAGQRLRAQDVGLAASIGLTALRVHRPLRIAVLSTGDEIREPGAELPAGAVYDANRYVLIGLLEALGCTVDDLGILPDEYGAIHAALEAAAARHELVMTSGGVSVGEEDHVKAAVQALGRLHFWRLAIKPGRPLAMGQVKGVPFIGLPGNPVAAMVTFVRFARPVILRLAGAHDVAPPLYRVRAAFDHKKKRDRREWVRARLVVDEDGTLAARKFERQGAGILSSLVEADGLVELPEDMTRLASGTMVDFLPFSEVQS